MSWMVKVFLHELVCFCSCFIMVFLWFLLFALRMNNEAAWVGQKGVLFGKCVVLLV